jgi:hypothetical protein
MGDSLVGSLNTVLIPAHLVNSSMLGLSAIDMNAHRVSRFIPANTIITREDIYNPVLLDVVVASSRWVTIDYLPMDGIREGMFVDIRIKSTSIFGEHGIMDDIVVSKKLVHELTDDGRSMRMILSESEMQNLNTAVMMVASDALGTYRLHMTVYVDPANQPRATVTFQGGGFEYTAAELAEAQQILRDLLGGGVTDNIVEDNQITPDEDSSEDDVEDDSEDQDNGGND